MKKNLEEIYQRFIGNGKIQALSIEKINNGGNKKPKWKLLYREGKKNDFVESDEREFLEKILIEFGGKNPETCRADDRFMRVDGTWKAEDLNELGHRITKIKLRGDRIIRSTAYPIDLPDNVGSFTIVDARRKQGKIINLNLTDRENAVFTLAFKEPNEFDNLCEFIFNHSALREMEWYVSLLGTESRQAKDHCVWQRLKAGDGTKRMVLELIGLNGNHFTECVRQDLFNAAGDMFFGACQRVSVKKKKEQTMEICMFAAEDGKIDLSNYDAID